jgi:phage FluMu protein Com
VLAYLRFRPVRAITSVHGKCPRCGIEQEFDPPRWGRTVVCPRCKNQLTLTRLDGCEARAAPG